MIALVILFGAASFAQTTLDPMVVTANKVETPVERLGTTVTVTASEGIRVRRSGTMRWSRSSVSPLVTHDTGLGRLDTPALPGKLEPMLRRALVRDGAAGDRG